MNNPGYRDLKEISSNSTRECGTLNGRWRHTKLDQVRSHHVPYDRSAPCTGFYIDVLSFRLSDTVEDDMLSWAHCNQDHHGIMFLTNGPAKMDHYCFNLDDWHTIKNFTTI